MQLKKFLLFSGVFCFLFGANFIDGMLIPQKSCTVPLPPPVNAIRTPISRSSSVNELNMLTPNERSSFLKMNLDKYLETAEQFLKANGLQDEMSAIRDNLKAPNEKLQKLKECFGEEIYDSTEIALENIKKIDRIDQQTFERVMKLLNQIKEKLENYKKESNPNEVADVSNILDDMYVKVYFLSIYGSFSGEQALNELSNAAAQEASVFLLATESDEKKSELAKKLKLNLDSQTLLRLYIAGICKDCLNKLSSITQNITTTIDKDLREVLRLLNSTKDILPIRIGYITKIDLSFPNLMKVAAEFTKKYEPKPKTPPLQQSPQYTLSLYEKYKKQINGTDGKSNLSANEIEWLINQLCGNQWVTNNGFHQLFSLLCLDLPNEESCKLFKNTLKDILDCVVKIIVV